MNDLAAVYAFALSLGLGLVLGLERERRPQVKAGLRTFGLTALLGTAAALLAERTGSTWLLPAGLAATALTMIAADRESREGPDTTTTIALLLCFVYGAMLWYGYTLLTVALALTTTALLYFKTELHEVSRHLSRQDMVSFLQFAVISFIVLPLLPDRSYGPYQALNPYRIWLMIVLIAAIGLAGYVALRLLGSRREPSLFGVLGGLVSSTATTLVYARRVRTQPEQSALALVVIVIANLVQFPRLLGIAAVVSPHALAALLPTLGAGFALGLLPLLPIWRRSAASAATSHGEEVKNPLELGAALSFGAIYAGVLMLTAWMNAYAGAHGIYALAPFLGLTDMDAITLSSLRLFDAHALERFQLAAIVALALVGNFGFKLALALAMGGRQLAARLALCLLPILPGLAIGVMLVR